MDIVSPPPTRTVRDYEITLDSGDCHTFTLHDGDTFEERAIESLGDVYILIERTHADGSRSTTRIQSSKVVMLKAGERQERVFVPGKSPAEIITREFKEAAQRTRERRRSLPSSLAGRLIENDDIP